MQAVNSAFTLRNHVIVEAVLMWLSRTRISPASQGAWITRPTTTDCALHTRALHTVIRLADTTSASRPEGPGSVMDRRVLSGGIDVKRQRD